MWKMINYEVCGRGHINIDLPCQDKTLSTKKNETYVIALSDGAGSSTYSQYGAKVVVNSISNILTNDFDELIEKDGALVKKEILKTLLKNLNEETLKEYCNLKDLASTLLAVAIKNDRFILVHLGDGVIGMIKNKSMKVVSKPQNGEFSNSTTFVTSNDALQKLRLYKGNTEKVDGFVIMSDGTAESFYDKRMEILSPRMEELFKDSAIRSEKVMKDIIKNFFDNIILNRTFDDCSIAMIVKPSEINASYDKFNLDSKCDLFGLDNSEDRKALSKKIVKFENILKTLNKEACNIKSLSKKLHIKKRHLKKHVRYLEEIGLVEKTHSKYSSNIMPS